MSQQRILIADDSRTIRTLLERALGNAGYRTETAANGREALDQMRANCPDLLILDIEMPELDGYAVCQHLRVMGPPWDALPVVFLTSVTAQAVRLLGQQLGAYVPKPICTVTLLRAVADHLGGGPSQQRFHKDSAVAD